MFDGKASRPCIQSHRKRGHDKHQNNDDNPYKKVVLNHVFKEKDESPEMRNWSIFSDNVRYVQHDQATPQKFKH